MGSARSLHITCTTWDQVEAFYLRKLRRGNLISIKVSFTAAVGDPVMLSLELPSQLVIAIDGVVSKHSPIDGTDRAWLEIELAGLTGEVLTRLRGLVEEARFTSRPAVEIPTDAAVEDHGLELPADERKLFAHLSAELRRLRVLPVMTLLGVHGTPSASTVRSGWLDIVRRYHPDVVAPHRSAAISHLAEEIIVVANRAYDRSRQALVAEGRATALGSALLPPRGWLIGFDEVPADGAAPVTAPVAERRRRVSSINFSPPASPGGGDDEPEVTVEATFSPPASAAVAGGETFERRARTLLGEARPHEARELLATALCVYPRSRPLRALYHLATAVLAVAESQPMLAIAQAEAALGADGATPEAEALLELVRGGATQVSDLARVFR